MDHGFLEDGGIVRVIDIRSGVELDGIALYKVLGEGA
jgi:hypothetical protein